MQYKHHSKNSRIGVLHHIYDTFGPDSAQDIAEWLYAENPASALQSISDWKRGDRAFVKAVRGDIPANVIDSA